MLQDGPTPEISNLDNNLAQLLKALPIELLEIIFLLKGDDSLSLLKAYHAVNHACHEEVLYLSRYILNNNFPYIVQHSKFQENPLGLLIRECNRHILCLSFETSSHRFYPSLSRHLSIHPSNNIELIFWALRKDLDSIENAFIPLYMQQNLYGLIYAKYPELKDKILVSLRTLYIPIYANDFIFPHLLVNIKRSAANFVNLIGNVELAKTLHEEKLFNVHLADIIACGHPEIIKMFDSTISSLPPHQSQERRHDLLVIAAQFGRLNVVKNLLSPILKHTLDWKTWSQLKCLYLGWAFINTLSEGALVEWDRTEFSRNHGVINAGQVLRTAAKNGHLDIVKYLLSPNHPLIYIDNFSKYCALACAHDKENSNIVKYLLAKCSFPHADLLYLKPQFKKELQQSADRHAQRKIGVITVIVFLTLSIFPISWATLLLTTLSAFFSLELRHIYRRRAYHKYNHQSEEKLNDLTDRQRDAFEQGVRSGESYFEQCKSANPIFCPAANLHWQDYFAGQYAKMVGDDTLIHKVCNRKTFGRKI